MTPDKSRLLVAIVVSAVFACEWWADETHKRPEFPYQKFQLMRRDGTLAQQVDLVDFPVAPNILGRQFVRIWLKNDPTRYVMYVPPDFEKTEFTRKDKTQVYRIRTCGNGEIFGAIIRYAFEALFTGVMVFTFRKELFPRQTN